MRNRYLHGSSPRTGRPIKLSPLPLAPGASDRLPLRLLSRHPSAGAPHGLHSCRFHRANAGSPGSRPCSSPEDGTHAGRLRADRSAFSTPPAVARSDRRSPRRRRRSIARRDPPCEAVGARGEGPPGRGCRTRRARTSGRDSRQALAKVVFETPDQFPARARQAGGVASGHRGGKSIGQRPVELRRGLRMQDAVQPPLQQPGSGPGEMQTLSSKPDQCRIADGAMKMFRDQRRGRSAEGIDPGARGPAKSNSMQIAQACANRGRLKASTRDAESTKHSEDFAPVRGAFPRTEDLGPIRLIECLAYEAGQRGLALPRPEAPTHRLSRRVVEDNGHSVTQASQQGLGAPLRAAWAQHARQASERIETAGPPGRADVQGGTVVQANLPRDGRIEVQGPDHVPIRAWGNEPNSLSSSSPGSTGRIAEEERARAATRACRRRAEA